jgi:hypothetical protein
VYIWRPFDTAGGRFRDDSKPSLSYKSGQTQGTRRLVFVGTAGRKRTIARASDFELNRRLMMSNWLVSGAGAVVVAACIVQLTGCGTYNGLTPEAASVVATTNRPSGKCKSLGTLSGKGGGASGGYVSNEDLIKYALNDLRNQAAAQGATHIVYSAPTLGGNQGTTTSAMITGEALKCEAGQEPSAPTSELSSAPKQAAGCTYDAQCKGERICVKGECVEQPRSSQPSEPAADPATTN